jgi:hypothetical protein
MRTTWPRQTPPIEHSTHLEHRLTVLELTSKTHGGKITYLERAVQGLIWAVAAIATSKSGDVVDVMISLLKAKL